MIGLEKNVNGVTPPSSNTEKDFSFFLPPRTGWSVYFGVTDVPQTRQLRMDGI